MRTPEEVLAHHLGAFGDGDMEGILSDYTEESTVFTPEGVLHGPGEIRGLFEALLGEFGKPGATLEMKTQLVEGEMAYIVWEAETADNIYEYATDTFVIRDGKIVSQTLAAQITPKG